MEFTNKISEINRKEFPVGTILYYVHRKGAKFEIKFGTVEENYPSCIVLQLYEVVDCRLINNVPVKEFKTPTKWKKLPKGWTYNTELFDLDWKDYDVNLRDYPISNPDNIRKLIELKVLVPVHENDHCHFEAEIDSKLGWRIVRKYDQEYKFDYVSLFVNEVYTTYEETYAKVQAEEAELNRQANLSDYDWSVEQIDRTLNHWAKLYDISDIEKNKIRKFLLSQDRVEDIEVRATGSGIQWKYWKNKKWINIEV